jgi:YidC/Oxa1 family membrane protein insertase
MEIWSLFTHLIESTIVLLSAQFGLSEAASIITFTLLLRFALMPASLSSAYRMQKNKVAVDRIKPELEQLKNKYNDNPSALASQTMALYRRHGITFIDKISLMNMSAQAVSGLGVFQTLKRMIFSSKFLWIATLSKPDFLLTALVGVLMLLGMALMPGTPFDTSHMLMLLVPVVISMVAVAALPSALGIYWAASNVFTVLQTLLLRFLVSRRGTGVAIH